MGSESALWRCVAAGVEPAYANAVGQLMQRFEFVAVCIAGRVAKKLPDHVQYDEILQDGRIGLWKAIKQFDPGRGVKFTTFCQQRIRGEVYDGLRRRRTLGRLDAKRAAAVEATASVMLATAGHVHRQDLIAQLTGKHGSIEVVRMQRACKREQQTTYVQLPKNYACPAQQVAEERCAIHKKLAATVGATAADAVVLHFVDRESLGAVAGRLNTSYGHCRAMLETALNTLRCAAPLREWLTAATMQK